MGDENIDLEPDEFFSELLGAIASPVRITKLNLNAPAFRIAEGVQPTPESISEWMRRRPRYQHANVRQFPRLLCKRRERPRDGGAANERDQLAPCRLIELLSVPREPGQLAGYQFWRGLVSGYANPFTTCQVV